MNRFPVESSNLISIGWEDGVMEIEFEKGLIYQYEGVPEWVYQEVLHADSPGKAFKRIVVDRYRHTKL